MSIWERFARLLIATGPVPKTFSILHIIALIFVIGIVVVICIFNKKITTKTYKIIVLSAWIFLIILEVFYQLTNAMKIVDDKIVYHYHWLVFPFQLCSTPLYFLPFIVFLKDGVIKKRIELFLSMFMLIGGLLGYLLPAFSDIIWVNYQTLFFHGTMVIIPILIALKNREEFQLINLLQSFIIFFILIAIALILNWIVPKFNPEALIHGFNMYFISWHYPPLTPILKNIYQFVPYPLYLLLYIIGFIFITFIIYTVYSFSLNHKISLSLKKKAIKPISKKSVNK